MVQTNNRFRINIKALSTVWAVRRKIMSQIRFNNGRIRLILALVVITVLAGVSYKWMFQNLFVTVFSRDTSSTTKVIDDVSVVRIYTEKTEERIKRTSPKPVITTKLQKSKKKIYRSKIEIQNIEQIFEDSDPKFGNYFDTIQQYVHIDLKGAPPNLKYYSRFFPFLKRMGVAGVILEYEDMFPYEGNCKLFSAKNCYSEYDLKKIMVLATSNELDVIPLIQTFGHMEFILKHPEYIHLREYESNPQVITPTQEETYKLINAILDQVMLFHPHARYVHIGCDEVYNLGKGKSKSIIERQNISSADVFFGHVKKVAGYLRKTYGVQPLIWDDMIRHIDEPTLKNSKIGEIIEPMVWSYITDPQNVLPEDMWRKYKSSFDHLWIASSFKGATGSSQYITDATYHIQNHLSWIEIIKENELTTHLRGIALTGWQRYDHFAILCELLPSAIPSLVACLKTIQNGGFNMKVYSEINSLLSCNNSITLHPPTDSRTTFIFDCLFPGNDLYVSIWKYNSIRRKHIYIQDGKHAWASNHNLRNKFSSPFRIKNLKTGSNEIIDKLKEIETEMWERIPKVFDEFTAAEWIEINVRQIIEDIQKDLIIYDQLLTQKSWPRRALNPISKDVIEKENVHTNRSE